MAASGRPRVDPRPDVSFLRRHGTGFGVLSVCLSGGFLAGTLLAALGGLDLLDAEFVRSATAAIGAILLPFLLPAIGVFIADADKDPALSFGGRVAWIAGLVVVWIIALPVYWWRYVRIGSDAAERSAPA
jgi:hypothetical protein